MNVVMTGDGPLRRGAGHRRRRRVHPRRARRAARRSPSSGSPRSSTLQREMVADAARAAVARPRDGPPTCRSSSRPPNPDKAARDPRRCSSTPGVDVELVPRPTTVPDVEETGHDARGERAAQGRGAARRHRAARGRRRHRARGRRARRRARRVHGPVRGRGRDLRRQRREAARASWRGVTARRAHRPVPNRRGRSAGPTAPSSSRGGEVEGVIADEPRGERRLRLRPGVRPDRGRRPHVRGDDAGREACDLAPRPGVAGARGAAARGCVAGRHEEESRCRCDPQAEIDRRGDEAAGRRLDLDARHRSATRSAMLDRDGVPVAGPQPRARRRDRDDPGPAGPIPVRVYRPSRRRPAAGRRLLPRRRLGHRQTSTPTTDLSARSPTRRRASSCRSTTGSRPSTRSRPPSTTASPRSTGSPRTRPSSAATRRASRSAATARAATSPRSSRSSARDDGGPAVRVAAARVPGHRLRVRQRCR